ncbi:MAG: methylisocitrate lyase [Planctomycetota bacterium]|nr:MAG: methylisocitrate lyase [Planctomycetota bacterium]REK40317.1 MAG: methylisocitrate lyase [Planctomycetota bacterium]
MSDSTPGQRLREAVRDHTIQVPGAPNALVARLAERCDYPAVYLSGAALSAGVLAVPDVGLFSRDELVQQTRYITRRIEIPLIVDADTGFGDAMDTAATVTALEEAGAAAVQLEDQELPKRCGHLSGKTLVTADEMCDKLGAAVAARNDDSLVIVARTDARGVTDFNDAVARANAYVEAGADWIFAEALTTRDEFARFAEAVDVPLIANMTEFGKSPLLTLDALAELGYAAALYPVTLLRIAMKAIEAALELIGDEGSQSSMLDLMQTREELYELIDYEDFESQDRAYFS